MRAVEAAAWQPLERGLRDEARLRAKGGLYRQPER